MPSRSPIVVVEVVDKKVCDYEPSTSLPIVSMHRSDFLTVHDQLHPSTTITESNLPVRTMVEHYEQRVQELEREVEAQRSRQDRADRALFEVQALLKEHSLTLAAVCDKLDLE